MAHAKEMDPITRVMLWAPPRTTSTAILKSLTKVPNSQMWCEPFLFTEFYNGRYREGFHKWVTEHKGATDTEDRVNKTKGGFLAREASFSQIKQQLESSPPNIKLMVCKEMVWSFPPDRYQYIPRGFKHVFLIRHPYKVFKSWKKMMNNGIAPDKQLKLTELPDFNLPKGYFFGELYDMYEHIKKTVDPDPVILYADDLLANPSVVFKAFCEAVNIPYTDDLLRWDEGPEYMDSLWMVAREEIVRHHTGGHNDSTFETTGFNKPGSVPKCEELEEDVLFCANAAMKCFQELYDNRMKF